jgi:hypothetical protein
MPTNTESAAVLTTTTFELEKVSFEALAHLPKELRDEIMEWHKALLPIAAEKGKRLLHLSLIASRFNVSPKTAIKKFYRFKQYGIAGLIDRRAAGPNYWNVEEKIGLSIGDRETLKTFCEQNQRGNKAAIREMRRQWQRGTVTTDAPLDAATGFPRGWSEGNLARYAPSEIELAAARQGRSGTDAHRSLVYTTRRELYVGQYYLFDDIWHDHYCNLLATRQTGRPLEFHGLDLASAYKMCWGMRLRREVADEKNGGTKMESLKVEDFRFLLASFLCTHGYNPRGTTLVVEHATTAIDERVEQMLALASCGAIKVERGGMVGAAVHAGQYAGRAKGNFRIKAALESLGNLIHNEFAALPGQTGKDRQHAPEQLHGLLKHNDALLWALSQITPERAQWLQWDLCTLQQFQLIAQEVYARINARTNHNLEGWDERYVPDRYTGRMRRMSPAEVWTPGARHLRPIGPETAAMIIGKDGGKERPVRKGEIEVMSSELSGDPLRFDAHHLPPRATYLCVLNPFDTKRLTLFDSKGGYVTTLNRIDVPSRDDMEALQRSTGRAEKALNEVLLPMRRRAMKKMRAKRDRALHNHLVTDTSRPFTPEEKLEAEERRALTVPITDFLTEDGEDPRENGAVLSTAQAESLNDSTGDDGDDAPIASMEDFI